MARYDTLPRIWRIPLFATFMSSDAQPHEIAHNLSAILGQDAFGMKLHAPDREVLVPHAHDLAFVSLRGHFQAGRHGVALDHEGMVARRGKRIRHAGEQVLVVMLNGRSLAVHHAIIDDDVRAEGVADALVSEANAKGRNVLAKGANHVVRETRCARRTGTGRYQKADGLQLA